MLLDRVQKYAKKLLDKQINKDQASKLKKLKLIEGRYPSLFLSFNMSKHLGKVVEYEEIYNFNNFRNIFESSIIQVLKFRPDGMSRSEITQYSLKHIPSATLLDFKKLQKDIINSLTKLKKKKLILLIGETPQTSKWYILK